MASSTRNVKLGVCQVYFDGIDLGYTKGGVEVNVETETYESTVDQFGSTPINALIMKRAVTVQVPMAETTIENMLEVMPGATLVLAGGAKATGTFTPTGQPTANQTLLLNGVTITAKASGANAAANEFNIGGSVAVTLTNLRDFLNASTNPALAIADYTASATVLTITHRYRGTEGNAYTVATGTWTGTVSGATLSGGTDPTAKRIDVADGVGTDLLTIAKELRLHPQNKPASDRSEDFVIPLASTAGGLSFAYKLDEERVYNVEFKGFPNSAQANKLFSFGDPAAVAS